jgi:D-alanyl-D-alanine dipeptidase
MRNEQSKDQIDLEKPIPTDLPSVEGWKMIPVEENSEPLVPLGFCSGNEYRSLFTASAYGADLKIHDCYGSDGVEGGLTTVFVRQEIAAKLLQADKQLPNNYRLVIFDAYRTLEAQKSLYDQYFNSVKQLHPDISDEDASKETQKMVSLPSTDPAKPSPHNTGGAVDLAIFVLPDNIEARVQEIDQAIPELDKTDSSEEIYKLELERHNLIAQHAKMLNFGTAFDKSGAIAGINYYESPDRELSPNEIEARNNRRLLYNTMKSVGFSAYPDEWWHFNFGSQMDAKAASKPSAQYGGIDLSDENLRHEATLEGHRRGVMIVDKLEQQGNRKALNFIKEKQRLGGTVVEAVKKSGDYSQTSFPQIEAIKEEDDQAA